MTHKKILKKFHYIDILFGLANFIMRVVLKHQINTWAIYHRVPNVNSKHFEKFRNDMIERYLPEVYLIDSDIDDTTKEYRRYIYSKKESFASVEDIPYIPPQHIFERPIDDDYYPTIKIPSNSQAIPNTSDDNLPF
jgi:hypothetical protein